MKNTIHIHQVLCAKCDKNKPYMHPFISYKSGRNSDTAGFRYICDDCAFGKVAVRGMGIDTEGFVSSANLSYRLEILSNYDANDYTVVANLAQGGFENNRNGYQIISVFTAHSGYKHGQVFNKTIPVIADKINKVRLILERNGVELDRHEWTEFDSAEMIATARKMANKWKAK